MSCLGILEIKRSGYRSGVEKTKEVLTRAKDLIRPLEDFEPKYEGYRPGLGVVCLLENDKDKELTRLIERGEVVVLSRLVNNEIHPDGKGIHVLMHYLGSVRSRYQEVVGTTTIEKYQQRAMGPQTSAPEQGSAGTTSTASGYKTPDRKAT
jgi:glutamate/tyrosine decarboxylase-like PLP-dependent enzyme